MPPMTLAGERHCGSWLGTSGHSHVIVCHGHRTNAWSTLDRSSERYRRGPPKIETGLALGIKSNTTAKSQQKSTNAVSVISVISSGNLLPQLTTI